MADNTLVDVKRVCQRFGVDESHAEIQASLTITPGTDQPVVIEKNAKRIIELMRWGLVPQWAKDAKMGYRLINARSETAAEKPAFRKSLRTSRCLVPANGFYEWKEEVHSKQPYYFSLEKNELMALAGLWDQWQSDQGMILKTFTILTKPADKVVSKIHERMPVILTKSQEDVWLNSPNPTELLATINAHHSPFKLKSSIVLGKI